MDDPTVVIQTLIAERDELKRHCERLQAVAGMMGYPPGHFYSPIVDPRDEYAIEAVRARVSNAPPMGIDIDEGAMRQMLLRLAAHAGQFPFPRHQSPSYRFYFENPFFAIYDATVLFLMLLEFRPKRVVEVGSGFSSCLFMDTCDGFFDGAIELTLIDPAIDPARFEPHGSGRAHILPERLQAVPLALFETLEENDILFIDSSHVAKTGSDVNHYLFEILPRLRAGVLIHIHDILYPFEYPEAWVLEDNRSWNEAYLVRAFLQGNSAFEIVYWNNFVYHRMPDEFRASLPQCIENEGGSLWLKKRQG